MTQLMLIMTQFFLTYCNAENIDLIGLDSIEKTCNFIAILGETSCSCLTTLLSCESASWSNHAYSASSVPQEWFKLL